METYLPRYGEGCTREQAVLLTGCCCAGDIQSPGANTRLLKDIFRSFQFAICVYIVTAFMF